MAAMTEATRLQLDTVLCTELAFSVLPWDVGMAMFRKHPPCRQSPGEYHVGFGDLRTGDQPEETLMRKTEISENPAFTFRTFLLRLGLIGPEYKNVREHLLANLPGDRAWRYDRSNYPSLTGRHREER